jgi:hypothetical protein
MAAHDRIRSQQLKRRIDFFKADLIEAIKGSSASDMPEVSVV